MTDIKTEDDGFCFACGEKNEAGLKLKFEYDPASKTATTCFTPQRKHQGYRGITHGGIIGLVLDEAMAQAAIKSGLNAVTAELCFRLKNAAETDKPLYCKATINEVSGKLAKASAVINDSAGRVIATADAKLFIRR